MRRLMRARTALGKDPDADFAADAGAALRLRGQVDRTVVRELSGRDRHHPLGAVAAGGRGGGARWLGGGRRVGSCRRGGERAGDHARGRIEVRRQLVGQLGALDGERREVHGHPELGLGEPSVAIDVSELPDALDAGLR